MPIKPKRISFTPHTPDDDGVSVLQQRVGAGALTITGADAAGGVARFAAVGQTASVGYQIGLASTGNLSGVNFTITGTAPGGAALVEVLAGPNNNTVETTGYFETVTAIATSGTIATDVKIGAVDEFATPPIPVDIYCSQTTLAADITGTINYTVQACYERVTAGQTPNWGDAIAAGAIDAAVTIDASISAVRLVGNSFTGGATLALNINQPRYI